MSAPAAHLQIAGDVEQGLVVGKLLHGVLPLRIAAAVRILQQPASAQGQAHTYRGTSRLDCEHLISRSAGEHVNSTINTHP